uniref:Peptidase A2 domain-containing protein n=1 Tax=Panagrolaimus davidi TaxID=227884 RepID=A0A914QZF6_9BILA
MSGRNTPVNAPASTAIDPNVLAAAFATFMQQMPQFANPAPQPQQPRQLPNVPRFVHDPAKPNGATLWFDQLDSLFRLQPVTEEEKCALVVNALDSPTFEKVSRALLPDQIKTLKVYKKLRDAMVDLFDFSVSLFARRYSALNMEWKGPEYESIPELVARIRDSATAFIGITAPEVETLMLMMSMKQPALEGFRLQVLNKLNKQADTPLAECAETMVASLQTQREQRLPMKSNINFVQKHHPKASSSKRGENGYGNRHRAPSPAASTSSRDSNASSSSKRGACFSCGGSHERQTCKFKDAICRFCNKKGHIEKACISKKKGFSGNKNDSTAAAKPHHRSNVRAVQIADTKPQINSFHILKVSQGADVTSRRHMVDLTVNEVSLTAQMDDGADITLLSKKDYTMVGCPRLTGAPISANAANGTELKILGSFKSMVVLKNRTRLVDFYVADIPTTLLGIDFFKAFGINLVMDGELLCNMVKGNSTAPSIATASAPTLSTNSKRSPSATVSSKDTPKKVSSAM